MDGQDYRLAAANSWQEAVHNADPELARNYRSLAAAYLALARFRDHIDRHVPATAVADRHDRRLDQ